MTGMKITADSFLDNKELREEAKDRVEVLEKVKQLFLIPELECMTVKQVANYFEVDIDTVKRQYQRNQDEFDSDGTHTKTLSEFRSLSGTKCSTLKMAQRRGFLEITLPDTTVAVPNCGVKCYPKRAVLRMGMLLRDSRVAKEVRTQLLNTFEHTTEGQRTYEITKEKQLLCDVVEGIVNEKSADAVASLTEYVKYKNRYIAEIEQHNAELTQKNTQIEQANKDLTATNSAYTKEIQTWKFNSIINALMRTYARNVFPYDKAGFSKTWTTFYKQFKYKYSADIDARWSNAGEKGTRISYIKPSEYSNAVKLAVAMCEEQEIDTGKIINEVNNQAAKSPVEQNFQQEQPAV